MALALLILVPVPSGRAEVPAAAEALYQRGKEDLREGRYEAALEQFREGLALVGDDELAAWQMILGLALARERLEQRIEALARYREFLVRSGAHRAVLDALWQQRRELTRQKVAALEGEVLTTHGLLSVASEPIGAELIVDGTPSGRRTPTSTYLTPGAHRLQLRLTGYQQAELDVTLAAGERKPVSLTLAVAPLPDPEPPPLPVEPPPTAVRDVAAPADGPSWGWLMVATGATLAVGGVVSYGLALQDLGEQKDLDVSLGEAEYRKQHAALTDSMGTKETVAWTFWGLGAASIVGGVIALAVQSDDPGAAMVAPTRDGWRGAVTWRF